MVGGGAMTGSESAMVAGPSSELVAAGDPSGDRSTRGLLCSRAWVSLSQFCPCSEVLGGSELLRCL